jgi:hypothetical protein
MGMVCKSRKRPGFTAIYHEGHEHVHHYFQAGVFSSFFSVLAVLVCPGGVYKVQRPTLQLSAEGASKRVQPIGRKQRQRRGNRLATANGARDRRTCQHGGCEERELDAVGPGVLDLQAAETVESADGNASNDGGLASRASEADNAARRRQRAEDKRGELETHFSM